jgi:hypothetical protein
MQKGSKFNRKMLLGHLYDFLKEPNHFARTKLMELKMPYKQLTSVVFNIMSDPSLSSKTYVTQTISKD